MTQIQSMCVSKFWTPKSKQWVVNMNVLSDTSFFYKKSFDANRSIQSGKMRNRHSTKIKSGTFWHYNIHARYHEKKFLKSKFEAEAWQALQMLLTCWTSPVSLWIVKSQRLVCIYVCCCRCQNSQRNLQNCQKNYIIVEIVKIIINLPKLSKLAKV